MLSLRRYMLQRITALLMAPLVVGHLAVMIFAAVFVGSMIGFLAALGRDGTLLTVAAVMTTLFVVAILNDARLLRIEDQSLGLLR